MRVVLTERELDIMAVLWARGPSTVAEIRSELRDDLAHNTVLTLVKILEEKGHVGHVAEGRAHRFHPLIAREDVGTSALGRLVDAVFGGSAEALLTHFLSDRRLGRAELERARRLLDERLDASGRPGADRAAPRGSSARTRGRR